MHLVLPPTQIEPDLEQRTMQAVQRYCHARMKEIEQDLYGLRKRAVHALLLALVGLVIFINLGNQLSANPSWLLQILGQGFIVIGWVYLWSLLDSIIFGLHDSYLDKKLYEQLIHMHLNAQSNYPDTSATRGYRASNRDAPRNLRTMSKPIPIVARKFGATIGNQELLFKRFQSAFIYFTFQH